MSCYNICGYSQNNSTILINRNQALMMQKVKQTKTSLIKASKKTSKISEIKMQQQSTKIKRKGHNETQQSIKTPFKLNFIDSRTSQGYTNSYQSQMSKSKKSLSDFKKHNKNLSIQSCQSQYQQIRSQNQSYLSKFEKTENSTFHQTLPIGYHLINHTQQINLPLNNIININYPPFKQSYHSSNEQNYHKPISTTLSQNNKFILEKNYSNCKKSQICEKTSVGLKQSSKLSPIASPSLYYQSSQCKPSTNTHSILITNFDRDSKHFNNNIILTENTSKSIILKPSQQIRCQQRKREAHQRRSTQNQQPNNNFFNQGVETVESGWGSSQNYSSLVESNVIYRLRTNGSNFDEESALRQNSRQFYFQKKNGFSVHKPQQIKVQSKLIGDEILSFSLNLENTLKGTGKFLTSQKDKDISMLLSGHNSQPERQNYTAIINGINFICRVKKIYLSKLNHHQNIKKCVESYPSITHKNLLDIYYVQKTNQKMVIISEYANQDLKSIMTKNGGIIQQKCAKKYIRNIIQGLIYLGENNINVTLDINSIKIINGSLKIEWFNLYSLTQLKIEQRNKKKNVYEIGLISYLMVFGKSPQQTDIVTFKSLKQITSYPNISDKYRNFLENILIYDERYQLTLYQCLLHPLFY